MLHIGNDINIMLSILSISISISISNLELPDIIDIYANIVQACGTCESTEGKKIRSRDFARKDTTFLI